MESYHAHAREVLWTSDKALVRNITGAFEKSGVVDSRKEPKSTHQSGKEIGQQSHGWHS